LASFQAFFPKLAHLLEELTAMHLALREGFDWKLSFEQIIPILSLINQLQLHLSYFCHAVASKTGHIFDDYKWIHSRTSVHVEALNKIAKQVKKKTISTIRGS